MKWTTPDPYSSSMDDWRRFVYGKSWSTPSIPFYPSASNTSNNTPQPLPSVRDRNVATRISAQDSELKSKTERYLFCFNRSYTCKKEKDHSKFKQCEKVKVRCTQVSQQDWHYALLSCDRCHKAHRRTRCRRPDPKSYCKYCKERNLECCFRSARRLGP